MGLDSPKNIINCLAHAYQLAMRAESSTFPNPMVGAVISYEGKVFAASYHKQCGASHAEVNVINEAKEKFTQEEYLQNKYGSDGIKQFFADCILYVTLEPCSHHGKTPPCTELIIHNAFRKVVYACADPNPAVAGNGAAALRAANIQVMGPDELLELYNIEIVSLITKIKYSNRKFFKWIQTYKPWVTLKIACTPDGRMQTREDEDRWISNLNSRKAVHRLRSCNQALITSINTVIQDNALLTVRYQASELGLDQIKQTQRIILKSEKDFTEKQRKELKIFQKQGELTEVLEYIIQSKAQNQTDLNNQDLIKKNNALKTQDKSTQNQSEKKDISFRQLNDLVEYLSTQGYNSIMIEAGPSLSKAFLAEGLVDEIIHFEALGNSTQEEILNKINTLYRNNHNFKAEFFDNLIIPASSSNEADNICVQFIASPKNA